ncbi:MAG TPA: bifunctional lysylphosphatidylglycerol flippase/synthetase MprF [Ideonella sp.]|nr:bifunctional lysylphosphatidylglycerol flippase/synthetase MprF [Ideonella sp.]
MPPSRPPTLLQKTLGPTPGAAWLLLRPWLFAAGGIALACVVALALHNLLHTVRYADVIAALSATPKADLLYALLATALSYLALTGYDASALRYAGAEVKRSTLLLTSYVAYALGNTVGLGPLTGGAVRMRLYTAAGLTPAQVVQTIAFNTAAFGLGMTAFGALALLWAAPEVEGIAHAPAWLLRAIALALLAGLGGVLWLCQRGRPVNVFGRWTLRLPPLALAWRQLGISALDLAASAAALWFLLPDAAVGLPAFVAFYALAVVVSLVSHVPGGLGVFEAIMLLAYGGHAPPEAVLGALVLYRGIYYVLPLVLATALLAAHELRSGVAAPVGRMAENLSPNLMAALTLVAGVWLLMSGVTPASDEAAQLLAMRVPLPLVEASHFLGSVAGLGLLLVARGLLHRLDAAWWAALGLSLLAAVLALPKGIAVSEAAMLSTLTLLLVISRRQFDRRSSLFAQRLEPEWLLAVGCVLVACVWVLFFAYQQVGYANQLWWQFEFDAQAPRSLRALTAVVLIGLAVSLWHLLQAPAGELPAPTAEDIERAAAIVRANPGSGACAALMGDKHLLFSPSGKSFLMFGKQRRTWVSLYGPVGEPAEWAELVWTFVERAAEHGGRPAFYQVRPETLPLYLDAGLQAFKLGEYAYVPLHDFSLKGASRASLRYGINRAEREGMSFEVLPAGQVHTVLGEMRSVSDAWLAEQNSREKSFSVGTFKPAYLQRLPVALVRRQGRLIAFANLLVTDARQEASIDLMRHAPDAPPATMDFLFASIMLYLHAEGFQRFGLGMSPMAGMSERRSAPRWQRFGRLLFENGERFYNFRGLRSFKDKFEPVWEARYLAAHSGAAPLLALTDVAALIGGGVRGNLGK